MRRKNRWDSPHFRRYYEKQMKRLLFIIASILLIVGLFGYFLHEDLAALTAWVSQAFGIGGLMALTVVCDAFPSPVSPDLSLVLIAQGPLAENGWQNALLISLASVTGGHTAYWIGKVFFNSQFLRSGWRQRLEKQSRRVRRWGPAIVILGAITPFPMSITCIGAGVAKLPYLYFTLATLVRIPRLLIAYGLIAMV